jgi:hypothetical protein
MSHFSRKVTTLGIAFLEYEEHNNSQIAALHYVPYGEQILYAMDQRRSPSTYHNHRTNPSGWSPWRMLGRQTLSAT